MALPSIEDPATGQRIVVFRALAPLGRALGYRSVFPEYASAAIAAES